MGHFSRLIDPRNTPSIGVKQGLADRGVAESGCGGKKKESWAQVRRKPWGREEGVSSVEVVALCLAETSQT